MPILTVLFENGERRIPFTVNQSLREILDATDLRVRSGCRGFGTCGLCLIRIEAGTNAEGTLNERIILDDHERAQGIRLACQMQPHEDLKITLLAPAAKSVWRTHSEVRTTPPRPFVYFPPANLPPNVTTPYGVAVDLGTTHIRLALHELSSGRYLAGRYGQNPQSRYGSDIVTRLVAASELTKQAEDMSQLVLSAIAEALFDIASREGIPIAQVVRLVLVGNTAMLSLLSGRNHEQLLHSTYWMSAIDCLPEHPENWATPLGIHPAAQIEVLPPLAGFVGSDLLAGVLTTRLMEYGPGSLLIDFGTNSEIALWDGQVLWVTSAAGGPAFEESGISCGAPAEIGAINRVWLSDNTFAFDVIGDVEPCGICGSGLVDLIACLVRSGLLLTTGRFTSSGIHERFTLRSGENEITLSKRDVDLFQRAKGAIATGIHVLLAQAELRTDNLRRICVAGFFGKFLDVSNAQAVGLLPAAPAARFELCGSTALDGCVEALLDAVQLERMKQIGRQARLIDMSQCSDFDELFLENLYLQPMKGSLNQGEDHARI
jgi:uncharacterized 2Fe-2S/4Fe-4S cluster protein (DUF4445 family)